MATRHEARLAEQKDVAQGFKDDQQAAKHSDKAMKTLPGESAAELAVLAKLLA